jgi:Protein of unknown function (DUF2637)
MQWSTILRRLAFGVSFLTVAGVAAVNSYQHMRDVALLGHQPHLLASTLPLSVDGLLVIASLAMAEDKAQNRHARWWARIAFWFGATVSVVANIASTAVHYGDPLSIAVSAWPPVALLIAVEIMARPGRPKSTPSQPVPHAPAAVPQSPGMPPALIDSAEALAFRRAQAELRRTSRLPALNAPVTE